MQISVDKTEIIPGWRHQNTNWKKPLCGCLPLGHLANMRSEAWPGLPICQGCMCSSEVTCCCIADTGQKVEALRGRDDARGQEVIFKGWWVGVGKELFGMSRFYCLMLSELEILILIIILRRWSWNVSSCNLSSTFTLLHEKLWMKRLIKPGREVGRVFKFVLLLIPWPSLCPQIAKCLLSVIPRSINLQTWVFDRNISKKDGRHTFYFLL